MTDNTPQNNQNSTVVKFGRRATDRPENHHSIDNKIFNEYVTDHADIEGMLAYCFYKIEKVELCEKNPNIDPEDLLSKCREFLEPQKYEANRAKAQRALSNLENEIVAGYAQAKHSRDWRVGFGSGL